MKVSHLTTWKLFTRAGGLFSRTVLHGEYEDRAALLEEVEKLGGVPMKKADRWTVGPIGGFAFAIPAKRYFLQRGE